MSDRTGMWMIVGDRSKEHLITCSTKNLDKGKR